MIDLTEFFVSPNQQPAGVGRELLARAFSKTEARYRLIVATLDERALFRYLSTGVYARFPIKYFYCKAEKVDVQTDLQFQPIQLAIHKERLNQIDRQIIGLSREVMHQWIGSTRDGFVYERKYQMDAFTVLFMCNEPLGKFEHYLCFIPIFFI